MTLNGYLSSLLSQRCLRKYTLNINYLKENPNKNILPFLNFETNIFN